MPRTLTDHTAVIAENIRAAIRIARSGGVTGMSLANLRQITRTTGVTCAPQAYNRLFEEAARQHCRSFLTD